MIKQNQDVEALLDQAFDLFNQGLRAEARPLFERALSLQPDNADALNMLGIINHAEGNTSEGRALLEKCLNLLPTFTECRFNLALLYQDIQELDLALEAIQTVIKQKPDLFNAYLVEGIIYLKQNHSDLAEQSFQKGVTLNPEDGYFQHEIAKVYLDYNDFAKALPYLLAATELFPDDIVILQNVIYCLYNVGCGNDALPYLAHALKLAPEIPGLYLNLGNILTNQKNWKEAEQTYREALRLDPDFVDGWYQYGRALMLQGKLGASLPCFEKALELSPDDMDVVNNLGIISQDRGDFEKAERYYQEATRRVPDHRGYLENNLFLHNYHPDLPAEKIFELYCQWEDRFARPLYRQQYVLNKNKDPDRKLKIAYVSPDLYRHACHHFVEPLLTHHDKDKVDVYVYSSTYVNDEVNKRLRKLTPHWRDVIAFDDETVARMIVEDDIDILVDLAGHTHGNRLLSMALKPAPIQASWIGYGYTTGIRAIDYFFGDAIMTPEGCEPLFAEKIWRLPRTWATYRPFPNVPINEALPALENGHITFGSLSRSIRMNHHVIKTWASVLKAVPTAKLMINSSTFQDEDTKRIFIKRFQDCGIDANRLTLFFESPPWNTYKKIDISLDPFPHNAGTTTYDSLWCGVPVITKKDRPSVGRIGASILTATGLEDWIAETEEQYVDIAVEKSRDLNALQQLRRGMRERVSSSPVMDERGFAKEMEDAYRAMWQEWCRQ